MFVDLDPLLFVEFNAGFFRSQTFAERFSSDGDENFVRFEF